MSTITETSAIEMWRDKAITFALSAEPKDNFDHARIGMSLHDVRVRDSLMWHAGNGLEQEMYELSMLGAQQLPENMRCPALCIASVSAAFMGNEGLAVHCANWAYIIAPESNLAKLLILTANTFGLVDGVPSVLGQVSYDACRYGDGL